LGQQKEEQKGLPLAGKKGLVAEEVEMVVEMIVVVWEVV
jgi:hypothetical protein